MTAFHSFADIKSSTIGSGTTILQFTVVQDGAVIGENCLINPHCYIDTGVLIGNDVRIDCGVHLWSGVQIEDEVVVGPNVCFADKQHTTLSQHLKEPIGTILKKGAVIGGGAVVMPGLTIGERALVSAGAVVTRSVPPKAIVQGNPARIVGYIDTEKNANNFIGIQAKTTLSDVGTLTTTVRGVTIHRFPLINDIRGNLVVGEYEKNIPFAPKRYFLVLDVPSAETRGEHAHRQCEQFLICVKGCCSVVADDGGKREEFLLDRPEIGLYLPPMTWGIQYNYSPDAVLLVFASDYYDAADYIRDYDQFLSAVNA